MERDGDCNVRPLDMMPSYGNIGIFLAGGIVMTSPLAGAWEPVDDSYKGLFVFTDTHYSHAFMQTGRTNFQDENNPTDAEAADAYKTMTAGAGTYTFEGNRLTISEDMNRVPNGAGRPGTWEVSLEGDVLTSTQGDMTMRFRRVG